MSGVEVQEFGMRSPVRASRDETVHHIASTSEFLRDAFGHLFWFLR